MITTLQSEVSRHVADRPAEYDLIACTRTMATVQSRMMDDPASDG
jgi:hypothetical protein